MAQLVLFFDHENQLRAEAPSNGGRRKIELSPELKLAIMSSTLGAELISQRDKERRISEEAIRARNLSESKRDEIELARIRKEAAPKPGLAPQSKLKSDEHRAEMFAHCATHHPRQVRRWFPNRMPGETKREWQTRVGAVNAKPPNFTKGSPAPKPDLSEIDLL
jgi:hypothetical protein